MIRNKVLSRNQVSSSLSRSYHMSDGYCFPIRTNRKLRVELDIIAEFRCRKPESLEPMSFRTCEAHTAVSKPHCFVGSFSKVFAVHLYFSTIEICVTFVLTVSTPEFLSLYYAATYKALKLLRVCDVKFLMNIKYFSLVYGFLNVYTMT